MLICRLTFFFLFGGKFRIVFLHREQLILDILIRYLAIVKKEGLEISQPALDPNSTDIHHRITIRARTKKFHRYMSGFYMICTGESTFRVL